MATQFANVLDIARWARSLVDGGQGINQDAIPAVGSLQTAIFSSYAVASVPAVATAGIGRVIYVTDGASGDPTLAFCNSVNWLRLDNLEAVDAGA